MTLSLLSSPIFASSKKKKKMGNNNKLVVVAFFAITTIEEKKCDGNKFVVIVFFASSRKKENWVMITRLLSLPYSKQKTKETKKKKRQWHACAMSLFTSNIKKI
jgi:hypothetical protein